MHQSHYSTLFEVTQVWILQYYKRKEIYSAEDRNKACPHPFSRLSSCLSSAGILNTFLWDLLRIWKDWSNTWLDRHCTTLLNLIRRLWHHIKIEREAVRTWFFWIGSVKSLVKAPQICADRHYWYLDDSVEGGIGFFSFFKENVLILNWTLGPLHAACDVSKMGHVSRPWALSCVWEFVWILGACLQWWGSERNKWSITYTQSVSAAKISHQWPFGLCCILTCREKAWWE